ncbi:MAG: Sua5/YciO/YrdC/YwlC family protein, partial [Myxococcota bacterium]
PDLPKKLRKNLSHKNKVGIRVPHDPTLQRVLQTYNAPLLVSSANLTKKKGAHSEAQVRKNFGRFLDVLISAGDLPGERNSTVIDVASQAPALIREGSLCFRKLQSMLQVNTQANSVHA